MSDINKFTTKEVLNKVLLDSSGNAVEAFSHTTQEALNAALDTTNNRLNVSLNGGTISGDVTISGDLTVNGSATNSYDEIVNGDLHVKSDAGNSTSAFLVEQNDGTDVFVVDTTNSRANLGARVGTAILEVKGSVDNDYAGRFENTDSGGYGALVKIAGTTANDLAFQVRADSTNILTINGDSNATFSGNLGLGVSPSSKLHINVGTDQNLEVTSVSTKLHLMGTNDARSANIPLTLGFTEYDFEGATGSTIRLKSTNTNITGAELVGKLEAYISDTSGDLPGVAGSIDWTTNGSIDGGSTKGTNFTLKTYLESAGLVTNMVLDGNSRISLSNNDSGGTGGSDATSANTILGWKAGHDIIATGVANSFVGHGAGFKNTTGDSNSGFGRYAGFGNLIGDGNTFVGSNAGLSDNVTSHSYNTGIGFEVLKDLTDGSFNEAMGKQALQNLTTGDSNIAIGTDALGSATTSHNLIAIGRGAGYAIDNETADGTIAIGRSALALLTSGAKNVAIGYQAQASQTTGNRNTAIGYEAMYTANGGEDFNTVIGSQAGYYIDNDASHDNVIIGKNALQGGTGTILGNVAIGSNAMDAVANNNQTGTVAIGADALGALTSGANNTAIGYQSLDACSTGNSNVAVGNRSLGGNVDGVANVGMGLGALELNVSGNYNTAFGHQALQNFNSNIDGENTAVGINAGQAVSTGRENTILGAFAGDAITSGVQNVIVGADSDISAVDSGNEIVLGYGVTGQGANKVTLGNADITDVYMAQDSGALVHTAGIQFPASQVADGGANVLDDYEEGTYEPTLSYSTSGSVSADSNYATLSYTKIGNLVTVQGNIRIGSTGSQSGFLQFSLPFTSHSAGTDFEYRTSNVFLTSGVDFDGTAVGARIEENNSNMLLFTVRDNNSLGNITVAVNDDYFVNITYMVD